MDLKPQKLTFKYKYLLIFNLYSKNKDDKKI